MLLVEITINGTMHRVSNEWIYELTNPWRGYIVSFSPPQYQLSSLHGGYCRVGFGSVQFSPDLFDGDAGDWPPPVSCALTAKYTATTEAAAQTMFTGTAHLKEITRTGITYDLYAATHDTNLLSEAEDYDGNTVPLPRAFGTVTHETPVRLSDDVSARACYHKGYVTGTVVTNWHVYDDGVDIDANVVDNGDGTFSLTVPAAGRVTISGTGADTTLAEIVDWGATGLSLTYDGTLARATSPSINHWASSQMFLIDYLDSICQTFTHLIYVASTTLYLVDMSSDNGTRTLTEYQYFPSAYKYESPVASLKAEWQTKAAVNDATGPHIETYDHETVRQSAYPYGSEESVTPYHSTKSNIDTALDAIITIRNSPGARLVIPMTGTLPVPGEKISWTDTSLGEDTSAYIRARTIQYDLDKEEVMIDGEGAISAA